MQFMLLIYENEAAYGSHESGEQLQKIIAQHREFSRNLGASMVGGAGLKGTTTATTVRSIAGRQSIHDGPFAETKEQLGGFYLIEVADLDAAMAIAKKVPVLKDGCVEVRPLISDG